MKLATIKDRDTERVWVDTSFGFVPMESINRQCNQTWPLEMLKLIQSGKLDELNAWYRSGGQEELGTLKDQAIMYDQVEFAPLYRKPRKIWGIGLNYQEHASDLSEKAPTIEPASFMKPDTTIIGHGDYIEIPLQSKSTTAEGELGIIIGRKCKDVERKDWLSVVAGFTTILDMTAEDILRKNPRYLTMSKSFDTFFSFGSLLLTPDEIEDVMGLNVATVINGQVHASNVVANMTFPPDLLVSFHSRIMTMLPGDVISTGTPGAVPISEGDKVECWIDGFEPLVNPVKDLKNTAKPRIIDQNRRRKT
jgi:2-keto-4-pentenoate hydratase/2-oxohepta-3-ene-1,7-dioic acid hydratase in catechol pathway